METKYTNELGVRLRKLFIEFRLVIAKGYSIFREVLTFPLFLSSLSPLLLSLFSLSLSNFYFIVSTNEWKKQN